MFHIATFFEGERAKLNFIHQDKGRYFNFLLCLENKFYYFTPPKIALIT
jgi:hypothetical protein